MTRNDIRQIIADTSSASGIPADFMIRVAEIESNLDPQAINRSSGAAGLFQFLPALWPSYGLDRRSVLDAASNTKAAIRKMQVADSYLTGKGIAVEPWMLYLAHQQGNYGASVILDYARQGRRIDELPTSPSNIRRNVLANIPRGTTLVTAADFIAWWKRKLDLPGIAVGTEPATRDTATGLIRNDKGAVTQWILAALATTTVLYTIGRITHTIPRIGVLP